MSDALAPSEIHIAAARKINEEARNDPGSSLVGKFIGIVDGRIVALADDLDEVVEQLRLSGVDPNRTFCFEVGLDYSQVEDVWGQR